MVVMGRVVAPYGIYGWLKIQPDTETIDSLFDYDNWWLGRDPKWQEYPVEAAKVHGKTLLVKLVGIDDRDAAFAAKGKQVSVPREQLPEAEEGEYYWSDLIGLRVSNLQQVDFGTVVDVFETGANDVVVVKDDAGRERLVPFTAEAVPEVNVEAGTMLVDWDPEF
ncbi:ribosome maturation factor RimM [Methylovorus mays]|jgi:16S rRNA processing protein RimM|uniref:Ribosome maturation factor RimM n=2 Tax=Methylophilaceae TaxID=32011 RepID=C6XA89_METGS|nr:ribosome maturation factor RimM [Methylovorus mays]ACT51630.1 16S rRNA processing protein RimM [Methylovorus glucosotrophus SIP3-4]MCB5207909.1 ribosome maturation factor RimM [Methylovorus mays]